MRTWSATSNVSTPADTNSIALRQCNLLVNPIVGIPRERERERERERDDHALLHESHLVLVEWKRWIDAREVVQQHPASSNEQHSIGKDVCSSLQSTNRIHSRKCEMQRLFDSLIDSQSNVLKSRWRVRYQELACRSVASRSRDSPTTCCSGCRQCR